MLKKHTILLTILGISILALPCQARLELQNKSDMAVVFEAKPYNNPALPDFKLTSGEVKPGYIINDDDFAKLLKQSASQTPQEVAKKNRKTQTNRPPVNFGCGFAAFSCLM